MANRYGPGIPANGLELCFDRDNNKGGSAHSGYGREQITGAANASVNPTWANNITQMTIIAVIKVNGNDQGYAYHPISKWNNNYSNNTSFVLYHFQDYQGSNPNSANRMTWYGNNTAANGTGWGGLCGAGSYHAVQGKTHMIVAQFNSTDGGQMWTGVDGAISKHGGRGSSGARGQTSVNSTTGNMAVYGPTDYNSIQAQYWTGFWSRELSDDEIVQVFDAHKGRFNI